MATNPTTIEAPRHLAQRLRTTWRGGLASGSVFYASTMVANGIGFFYLALMARVLPVAAYGELVTLTALVYVFGVVTRSLQARAAQLASSDQRVAPTTNADARHTLRQLASPLLVGSAALFAVGAAASPGIASFLKLTSVWPVILLAAYIATHFLLSGPRGLLLGSQRLYYLSWVTLVDPLARLAVGLALAGRLGTSGAMWGYVVGNLVATLAAIAPLAGRARAASRASRITIDRQLLGSLWLNGALMLLASADVVAVRRYYSETVAGHYAVAFLLGRIIVLSANAVSWVVFSRAVNRPVNDPRAAAILLQGLIVGGAIAGGLSLVYWIAPGLVATVVGGTEFQAAGGFVGLVGLEMLLFTVISVLTYYHMAVRNWRLWLPFAAGLMAEVLLLSRFHATPQQVLWVTITVMTGLLVWVGAETMRCLHTRAEPGKNQGAPSQPRMAMVVHSHYPSDPRVRREAEALVEAGWAVDVICLPDEGQPAYEEFAGVRVYRLPVQRQRTGGPVAYLREYCAFFLAAVWQLARLQRARPYQVVQAHNMPDFLVFVGLLPRLVGARIILDVHDLVPEFYSVRFGLPLSHPAVRLTRWVQLLSARFADHVLTAGDPFRRQLITAGLPAEKVTSIMNSPDPALFGWRPVCPRPRQNGAFLLSYHGTLSEYNDLGVVLRAIAALRDELPGLRLRIFGRGRALPELQRQAAELGLSQRVEFLGFRPLDAMPALIAEADVGIVPQRRSVFTSLNYPTKAFEYIVLGVPVLMGYTPALDELFGHIAGSFFQPENADELARRLRSLAADVRLAQRLAAEQQQVCARFAWPGEKRRYLAVVHGLIQAPRPAFEAVAV